ncbi:MAG: response regulator, partial [Lachnospiraceae bacterium]|nr:response regulator [Lachnospiraceae bacterium]
MNILALDDERLILDDMLVELKKIFEDDEVVGYETSDDALNYVLDLKAHGEVLDYAFLDINLRGITGIEFAKKLKEVQPDTKIVFCT